MCLLFHKKEYVAIRDIREHNPISYCGGSAQACPGQIARWICRSCGKMGEKYLCHKKGFYAISFEKLVPDEKRWANFTS